MSRPNPKTPRAPTPPSAAYIASTVDTYMANIEAVGAGAHSPPSTRSKQKRKLTKSAAAAAAIAAAADGTAAAVPRAGNFCRNPFCGAKLASAFAKFCDQKANCQLYRGLLLHCGSFASVREQAVDDALEKLRETKRRRLRQSAAESSGPAAAAASAAATAATTEFSIPKRKVPTGSPTSAPSSSSSTTSAAASREASTEGDRLRQRYERTQPIDTPASETSGVTAAASADVARAPETSSEKKRRLSASVIGGESSAAAGGSGSQVRTPQPSPSPAAPSRPPTPVNKVGGIEVIPLGAGRHSTSFGGGSRYVQSGNRPTAGEDLRSNNPLLRVPSAPKPPTPTEPVAPPLPPRTGSADPRLQQRAPAWVESSRHQPVVGRSEVPPSSSPDPLVPTNGVSVRGVAQPAKRTISASEYLNSRKPQDPRVRPPQSNGDVQGSAQPSASATLRRSASDLSSAPASAFPNGAPRERTLSRSLSEISAQRHRSEMAYRDSDPSFSRSTGEASSSSSSRPPSHKDPSHTRSSSYDAPSSYIRREYEPDRQPSSRPYSPERHHEYAYEPDFHRSSSSYPQDRAEWQRRNEEPPRPQYRDPAVFAAAPSRGNTEYNDRPSSQHQHQQQAQPQVQAQTAQRNASMLPEIPVAMFSSHDRFLVNLLSRLASFYPKALAPVLNKTKKPRKMRFYLDYVERVKELSGSRFDVRVADGKGIVSLAGREWLALKGTSTVDLYVQILETLLDQGNAWRKLVEDSHRVYGNGVKRLGDRADLSTAFLRMWQGMKYNIWEKFPTERIVTYFRGDTRHHWTFCVANVELGSGSHEEKREAFRLAAENSMRFLLSLEILNDSQRHTDERERDREQSGRREPRESDRATGSNKRASRDSSSARSGTQASRQPASAASGAAIEIVDTPETTLSRPRDGSFGSDADGVFSPGDHGASEDDMEISEGDDVSRSTRESSARQLQRAPSASFDAMDLLQNGLSTHR